MATRTTDSSASDRKIAEGLEHLRLADKCMKTSLFKWKPDADGAVSEYTKAGTSFRNAKAYEEAKSAYIRAAELQRQMDQPFHAAKSYEQAALICKDSKELEEAVDLMEKASLMFQEHGTPDTAALVLEKAAKMVELTHPQKAIDIYKKACDVSELEDKPRQCAECIGKAGRLLIKCNRYDEALEALKKEIDFYAAVENYPMIYKLVIGVTLLHLHQEDSVAADQFFRSSLSYPGLGDGEEGAAVEELLQAYDDGDDEAVRRILSLPLIKFMDNAFARLARDLVVPGGVSAGSAKPAVNIDNVVDEQIEGEGEKEAPANADEEDDFEGGLC